MQVDSDYGNEDWIKQLSREFNFVNRTSKNFSREFNFPISSQIREIGEIFIASKISPLRY